MTDRTGLAFTDRHPDDDKPNHSLYAEPGNQTNTRRLATILVALLAGLMLWPQPAMTQQQQFPEVGLW